MSFFVLCVLIGGISNYFLYSFFLKIVANLILLILITIQITNQKIKIFKEKDFIKLILFIIAIMIYLSIAILYSIDPKFGFAKLSYFLTGNFIVILSTYYLFKYKLEFLISEGVYFITFIGCISVVYVIIFSPFQFGLDYEFELTRWSHVFYSRFIGSVFLIWFIFVFYQDEKLVLYYRNKLLNIYNKYKLVINCFFIIFLAHGVYLAGSRASILFILIITTTIFIFNFIKAKLNINNIIYFIISIGTFLFFIYFYKTNDEIREFRYESFFELSEDLTKKEGSVTTRIDMSNIALRMFSEKPILGYGLGSFYSYGSNELIKLHKYPHNIFLEAGAELGIVGQLIVLSLIFLIFKWTYRFSILIFFYFIYSFGLSLFSKDIATQTLLWIGLAFIFIKRGKDFQIENNL